MKYNISVQITLIDHTGKKVLTNYRKEILKLGKSTLKELGLSNKYVLSVVLVDDKEIQTLNAQYRHLDKPTDVITFALRDNVDAKQDIIPDVDDELGDIFINLEAAKRQAKEYKHSLKRELLFLFVHGLLHLLGYDHKTKTQEQEMFKLQHQILDEVIPFDDQTDS